jgi:hypothetical protein
MPKITGPTFWADIEWDANGLPVLYVIGHGKVTAPVHALEVIGEAVKIVNEGPHDHVCSVYNMLDVTQIPLLARFIKSGRMPSSARTAHLVLGTTNAGLRLVGSLAAVSNAKRLRTIEVCSTQAEVEHAVAKWLALPESTRRYTIKGF